MTSWCTDHRQAWIADMLRVYGYITRAHLQRMFGISEPQASIDLNVFRRAHPDAMSYDLSRKMYVATPTKGRGATIDPDSLYHFKPRAARP